MKNPQKWIFYNKVSIWKFLNIRKLERENAFKHHIISFMVSLNNQVSSIQVVVF